MGRTDGKICSLALKASYYTLTAATGFMKSIKWAQFTSWSDAAVYSPIRRQWPTHSNHPLIRPVVYLGCHRRYYLMTALGWDWHPTISHPFTGAHAKFVVLLHLTRRTRGHKETFCLPSLMLSVSLAETCMFFCLFYHRSLLSTFPDCLYVALTLKTVEQNRERLLSVQNDPLCFYSAGQQQHPSISLNGCLRK